MLIKKDFNPFIGEIYHTSMLSAEEMSQIHSQTPNPDRFVVGMQWVEEKNEVKFLMGNFSTITISCNNFKENEAGELPTFSEPWVDNLGFEIKFGNYIVDVNKVLYL